MHREGSMQFQSPVALRLLPTLPSNQQLKGPLPTGSQTERGGGSTTALKSTSNTGSKTHRAMASTNATSLAAVKQASERNQSLFIKISESVNNFSAVLRADAGRDAGIAEAAEAAQALSDVVKGIIRPSHPPAANSGGSNDKAGSSARPTGAPNRAPALFGRGRGTKQPTARPANASVAAAADALAAEGSSSHPLIAQIEKLMAACGAASGDAAAVEPSPARRRGEKAVKLAGDCTSARVSNPVVVLVRHVPLGYVPPCSCACNTLTTHPPPSGSPTRNCARCSASTALL
jgi:hypothetical protein